jgi:hypothetical protein
MKAAKRSPRKSLVLRTAGYGFSIHVEEFKRFHLLQAGALLKVSLNNNCARQKAVGCCDSDENWWSELCLAKTPSGRVK